VFASDAAPTGYLLAAFYWANFIYFGMGPRAGGDKLLLALPPGGIKLPGVAAEDIGKCALGGANAKKIPIAWTRPRPLSAPRCPSRLAERACPREWPLADPRR